MTSAADVHMSCGFINNLVCVHSIVFVIRWVDRSDELYQSEWRQDFHSTIGNFASSCTFSTRFRHISTTVAWIFILRYRQFSKARERHTVRQCNIFTTWRFRVVTCYEWLLLICVALQIAPPGRIARHGRIARLSNQMPELLNLSYARTHITTRRISRLLTTRQNQAKSHRITQLISS